MILSALFFIFYVAPTCALAWLQIRHIRAHAKPVILSSDDFQIARDYALVGQYFRIIESIFGGIIFVFWISFGLGALSENLNGGILSQSLFVVLFMLANAIIALPIESYKSLIIDKKFSFSTITIKLFILDTFKSLVMLAILGFLIALGLVWIMENVALWWIWGFALILAVSLVANVLYPTIIAPLFNRFTPLADESLKERIAGLMERVGFRANGIFVMDASKRDKRLNAYFGGLGKSKRVVLFDTLLNKVSHSELLAILGHELGHFKHKDLLKSLATTSLMTLALFLIAFYLPSFAFTGFPQIPATTLCVLFLIAPMLLMYLMPLLFFVSRKAEFAADSFGAELTSKADLANALIKLMSENKAFPYQHKMSVFFYMSHPPLLERLKALDSAPNDD